jgi:hypothetical protein
MPWFSVGPSSYPDLKGQTQYVNSDRIAAQFLSMCRDYAAEFGKNGDRLSANEGRRTKERCEYLYAYFIRHGYPIAAALYLSRHYEGTHGNAIDVGVTMANGINRALTDIEFAWMHAQCERRGFTWTGRYFAKPEPWHIEGATRAEILPPYPGINVDNAVPKPAPPVTKTPIGDIMTTEIIPIGSKPDYFLVNVDELKCLHLTSGTQVNFWKNRGVKQNVAGAQAPQVLANFEQVKGKGGAV